DSSPRRSRWYRRAIGIFSSPLGMKGGDAGSPLVDRLAPGVAGVGLVPVRHGALAEAPAEKYRPPIALAGEVHQPRIEREAVLDPELADLADAAVDLRGYLLRLALQLRRPRVGLVERGAAGADLDLVHAVAPARIERHDIAHDAADQGERAIRLLYGVR